MSHTFGQTASKEQLKKLQQEATNRGFSVEVVENQEAALQRLIDLIPEKSSVMTGSSTTLQQIGFPQALEENTKNWQDLGSEIWSEEDENARNDLRRHSTTADYFLASVNAITEDGILVAVDATGSRVGALPFAAKNVILVIGTQKVTKNLDTAFQRIHEYVFPKEDERAQEAYGVNSATNKWVIVEGDSPGRTTLIFVEEALGF